MEPVSSEIVEVPTSPPPSATVASDHQYIADRVPVAGANGGQSIAHFAPIYHPPLVQQAKTNHGPRLVLNQPRMRPPLASPMRQPFFAIKPSSVRVVTCTIAPTPFRQSLVTRQAPTNASSILDQQQAAKRVTYPIPILPRETPPHPYSMQMKPTIFTSMARPGPPNISIMPPNTATTQQQPLIAAAIASRASLSTLASLAPQMVVQASSSDQSYRLPVPPTAAAAASTRPAASRPVAAFGQSKKDEVFLPHLVVSDVPSNIVDKSVQTFTCHVCANQFHTQLTFDHHMQRKSVLIKLFCKICNMQMQFSNRCAYLSHLMEHKNVKPQDCISKV